MSSPHLYHVLKRQNNVLVLPSRDVGLWTHPTKITISAFTDGSRLTWTDPNSGKTLELSSWSLIVENDWFYENLPSLSEKNNRIARLSGVLQNMPVWGSALSLDAGSSFIPELFAIARTLSILAENWDIVIYTDSLSSIKQN